MPPRTRKAAAEAQPQQQQNTWLGFFLSTVRPVLQTILMINVSTWAMLVPPRDWTWPAAWFISWASVLLVLLPCFIHMKLFNPDLIHERQRFTSNKGTASFEMQLVPAVVVLMPLRYLAAGLQRMYDMQQPGWAPTPFLSTPLQQAAAAAIVISALLQTWAVCSNRYFSSVVRIQSDRGHKVCSEGPYGYVRHPAYIAFSIQGVAESLLLQSSWAMVLAVAKAALLAFRTVREEGFLVGSLPGYKQYTQQVKYRWVPFLW